MDYSNYKGRLACYDTLDSGMACFIPRCLKCGRFVKAGAALMNIDGIVDFEKPNAVCEKHGDVAMPFDGYWGEEDLKEGG